MGSPLHQRNSQYVFDCSTTKNHFVADGKALTRSKNYVANSLKDWPAGLKLNNELAAFLGDLFLWVIDHWSSE